MKTFVTQSKTLVSFPLILAIVKPTLLIGISTLKSKDVGSSITEAVAETKIVLRQKLIARVDVRKEKKNHQEHKHLVGMRLKDQLSHQDNPADQPLDDKRTAACYHMHLETVVSSIEDSTMTEVTEFVVNSFTLAVMVTKITLRHLKNVRAFVRMLLACVIWRLYTVDAQKISRNGIMMHIVRNVKSSNSAVVTEIRTTLMTRDHVKMLADRIAALPKLYIFRPQYLEL